jgi:hypothetical protein
VTNFIQKTSSSRIIKGQVVAWSGIGTAVSTNFSGQTYQVRVATPVNGWFAIDNLGTVPTTAGNTGTWIAANIPGETFTCTPGELFSFSSTSTSSGSVSLTELA